MACIDAWPLELDYGVPYRNFQVLCPGQHGFDVDNAVIVFE